MNVKRFALSVVAVFVIGQILSFLIHQLWLTSTYESLAELWRPEAEMMSKMWIMFVTAAIWSFFFCYIFVRGREGKGLAEGVRYGAVIGLFYGIPYCYDQYVVYPLPYGLVLTWFLSMLVTGIICGIVVAAIYKPQGG